MADERRDRGRLRTTRTRHPEAVGAAAPVAQVQDPAVRALPLVMRRALLMEVRAIERRCGLGPDAPDDAVA